LLLLTASGRALDSTGLPTPTPASTARFRLVLDVEVRSAKRTRSPASVDIDFAQELAAQGGTGTFDESTIAVVGYDSAGAPLVYNPARAGEERYQRPWRIDRYFPLPKVTFTFVTDPKAADYVVSFDTVESGLGRPQRYPGLVGDGDRFMQGYGRREIAACRFDAFADLDGDGDLDLFKGGVEPFIRVYENVGGNRFVDRGRLTSGGKVLTFPHDPGNRSWLSVRLFDWDGDGDQDLFVTIGATGGQVLRYENTTPPGGLLEFTERGPLSTVSGKPVVGDITFVDWDGDGRTDILASAADQVVFYRNVGTSKAVADMTLADGVYLEANGVPIQVDQAAIDVADIDGDGDLDLFVGTEDGRVYLFENVGTRTRPVLARGRMIVYFGFMDAKAGVKVADFDGDGLLDIVVGRYWERMGEGDQRVHGRFYKNVGTRSAPRFEARDAKSGAPYTERIQPVDAGRQNSVRAVDWDNDGRMDLIVGDSDGYVWYFRNQTDALAPLFAPGVRLAAEGAPIKVYGESVAWSDAGYARPYVVDWNGDGRKDLLIADARGWLTLYLNRGSDANPILAAGRRVRANGKPINGTGRASVTVCDWDGDGRPDVIFAMAGEDRSAYYDWPHLNDDPRNDRGFLFYKNVGTVARPVLAAPRWIKAGPGRGRVIDFDRPNLGSCVDWDGDGLPDLIASEFERDVRLFRATGRNQRRGHLRFESSANGTALVKPWTSEMISGADAVDWTRDGNIDILTGQGHGGSGLRFYSRDFIEDSVNATAPVVTIRRAQGRPRSWGPDSATPMRVPARVGTHR
jgi:VCBS repeat protein